MPISSTQVCDKAINKLAWDQAAASRKVGLGGSDGKLYVYDVAEKVAAARDTDWVDMQKTVQALTATRDAGGGLSNIELQPQRYR